MSEDFNPKIFIQRSDKELLCSFFETHKIHNEVEWQAGKNKVNNQAYAAYMTHKESVGTAAEEVLAEIHAIASKTESREAAYRIFSNANFTDVPQEARAEEWTVQDIALWAYMHLDMMDELYRWKEISKYAEAEKLNLSVMFPAKIVPLATPKPPDWVPDEEAFKSLLRENLLDNDGCGKHIAIIDVLLPEEDTYFVYYNRTRVSKNTFDDDGNMKNDEIDRSANDLCFVHDKINNKVYVRAPKGSRKNRKLELCKIFATTMLHMTVEQENPDKYCHHLDHIVDLSFNFTQDNEGKIKSVKLCEIGVVSEFLHDHFLFLRSGTNDDLLPKIQGDNKYNLFKNCDRIVSMTLQVEFCPSFSKRTSPLKVKITTDSLSKIRDKDEKEIIEKQLDEWKINDNEPQEAKSNYLEW